MMLSHSLDLCSIAFVSCIYESLLGMLYTHIQYIDFLPYTHICAWNGKRVYIACTKRGQKDMRVGVGPNMFDKPLNGIIVIILYVPPVYTQVMHT